MEPHLKIDEGQRMVWRILDRCRVLSGLGKMNDGNMVVAKLESIVEVKTMLEETMEKMRAKSRQEGVLENKLEIARKLLSKGDSPQEVAELLDLPEEEIKKLLH